MACLEFFDSIGLYERCTEEQHQTVREWLGLLKMEDMARNRFDLLSHSQQHLLVLARAMVNSPLLVILDEPCEGLDFANRRKVLKFIEFIGSQTATDLIYATHHKVGLPPCITHAVVLAKGKTVAVPNSPPEREPIDAANQESSDSIQGRLSTDPQRLGHKITPFWWIRLKGTSACGSSTKSLAHVMAVFQERQTQKQFM